MKEDILINFAKSFNNKVILFTDPHCLPLWQEIKKNHKQWGVRGTVLLDKKSKYEWGNKDSLIKSAVLKTKFDPKQISSLIEGSDIVITTRSKYLYLAIDLKKQVLGKVALTKLKPKLLDDFSIYSYDRKHIWISNINTFSKPGIIKPVLKF